jgi:hypothetical protein
MAPPILVRACRLFLLAFALGGIVTGCSSSSKTPTPEEQAADDREFSALRRLARSAFENGQYGQAVTLYERALTRAFARDDLPAIGDLGYESALALLRDGHPDQAAKRASETAAELTRRGQAPFPALTLVEAAALYAAGKADNAIRAAELTRDDPRSDAPTRARATYILGMIAADKSDRTALDRALSSLGTPTDPSLRADQQELLGRSRLLAADPTGAQTAFETTINLRRDTKDLTGTARALAFAGQAAADGGRTADAADLYLRAGRSAQANSRPADAARWLQAAERLAQASGANAVLVEARDRLSALEATTAP